MATRNLGTPAHVSLGTTPFWCRGPQPGLAVDLGEEVGFGFKFNLHWGMSVLAVGEGKPLDLGLRWAWVNRSRIEGRLRSVLLAGRL